MHGDETFAAHDGVLPATDDDYSREYLSLDISAAVVPDLDEAMADHDRATGLRATGYGLRGQT